MRTLIHQSLEANTELAEIVEGRIYNAMALGVGDIPAEPDVPYIAHREEPGDVPQEVQETSDAHHRVFRITAYVPMGAALDLERIHALVRQTFKGLPGTVSPSGAVCMGLRWLGMSEDIADDSRDEMLRFATYRFTTSK